LPQEDIEQRLKRVIEDCIARALCWQASPDRLEQTVKVLRSDPSLWLHYFGIAKPQVTPEFDTHTHFGKKENIFVGTANDDGV